MRTVLTGGSGVIGRAAVSALLEAGHEVVAVSRSARGAELLAQLGATPVRGDVLALDSLVAAYEGAEAVVNLASKLPVGHRLLLPWAWRTHHRLRTTAVANVVQAARSAGVRRVLQASTTFLYADQGERWITEQSPVDVSPVTEPAAIGESLVQGYSCDSRVGVLLRLGMVVGADAQTGFWLNAAAHGLPVGMGRPDAWVHLVHTDDLGTAVVAGLRAPSGVYNVGAAPVRRHDLVQGYADAANVHAGSFLGATAQRLVDARLEPVSRSLRVSSDHFVAQTGWRPTRSSFETGWLDAARGLQGLRR